MRTAALGGFSVDYQTPPSTEDFRRVSRYHWINSMFLLALFIFLSGVDGEYHASCFAKRLSNSPFPLLPVFSINDRQLKQPTRINNIKCLPPILGTYGDPSRYFSRAPYGTSYSATWLYHVRTLPLWSFFPFLYPQPQRHRANAK